MDNLRFNGYHRRLNTEVPGEAEVLRAVFKNLAVGVVVCDVHGSIAFFSPEAERMLGSGETELEVAEWSTIFGLFRPDMVTLYPSEELPIACAMRGKEELHELLFVRNPQQPGLWVDASGIPLRDSSGALRGGVAIFHDVSVPESLLRSETATRTYLAAARQPSEPPKDQRPLVPERLARFRTMYDQLARAVDQVADGIFITDSRGIIEYANPAFETITGFSAVEVLGRKPNVLKSGQHDASFYSDLWAKLASGKSFRGIIINRDKSGDLFWSAQTISPIKDQTGVTTHFVSAMRNITAVRKQHEREFQMGLARELQQRYYNAKASLQGFEIAAGAQPADETGGDYFDFIPQFDGSLYVVIADVAGHGFGSALVMAELRASLRAHAATAPDISRLLGRVNRSLIDTLGGNRFVTMLIGRIDPEKRTLEYISAGHGSGYLVRLSGEIGAELISTAPPLGLFPDLQFSVCTIQLEHGDTLLLLTDGITESLNPDDVMFGADGALEVVRRLRHSSAAELVREIYRAARAFSRGAPQVDDITSVIIKVE
jgi:PAS domain S-box-containing protein